MPQTIEKTLANGMKVILVHKPGFVQSFAMIGIPAGSLSRKEERDGEIRFHPAGTAHFLEHQMFYLNGEDVTSALADIGASSNAFTSLDRTCYYVWTSEDPLPAIRLLIDFVQTIDLSEQTVAKEKGIILSEYAMYDQEPSSRIFREALQALYVNHPIRDDILGSPEDIRSMSDADLGSFYSAFYDPSRLVMVVISAMDPEKILRGIEEAERNYPALEKAGKIIFDDEPEEVFQERKNLFMEVASPYALLGVKTGRARDDRDAIRLDLMSNIWLEGMFSRLNPDFPEWIREGTVTQSLATEADYTPDHGHFLIYSQSMHPERFFDLARQILEEKKPLSEEVFEGLKNGEIAQILRNEDQFEALAADLAAAGMDNLPYETTLDIVRDLTNEDINRWLETTDFSHQSEIVIHPRESSKEE